MLTYPAQSHTVGKHSVRPWPLTREPELLSACLCCGTEQEWALAYHPPHHVPQDTTICACAVRATCLLPCLLSSSSWR